MHPLFCLNYSFSSSISTSIIHLCLSILHVLPLPLTHVSFSLLQVFYNGLFPFFVLPCNSKRKKHEREFTLATRILNLCLCAPIHTHGHTSCDITSKQTISSTYSYRIHMAIQLSSCLIYVKKKKTRILFNLLIKLQNYCLLILLIYV